MQQPHDFLGQLRTDARDLELDDFHFPLGFRKVDVKMETTALERVGHFPAVVAGQDHQRHVLRFEGADLRNRDLKIAQDFQQKCFKLSVGFVDLVD